MPNRGQNQDQTQKGRQNPAKIAPGEDEDVEGDDESPLGAQPQTGKRNRRDSTDVQGQPDVENVEDEEAEDDEDDQDGIGARP